LRAGPLLLDMRKDSSADGELVEGLRRRDADALAAAYDRYGTLAYSILLRITRDQSVAEDLLQELFLRVWNRARDFDPEKGAFGVWLLSIARNMAIDHVRSASARFQSRVRPFAPSDQIALSYKPRDPESVLDSAKAIKSAFSGLTANQKKVLELAYFEGLSQTEIAAHLQEPLGTVKSWMRSGMERLRAVVKAGASK